MTSSDFKKLISIHTIVPVLYGPFLVMLLQSYPLMLNQQAISIQENDQNIFNLNISELDRESFDSTEVVEAYEQCLAIVFQKPEDLNYKNLIKFFTDNPVYSAYGFHKGFGQLLFNLMLMEKSSERWLMSNFIKLHILGVKDPTFL